MQLIFNKRVFKTFILFLSLATLVWLFNILKLNDLFDVIWLDSHIRNQGIVGYGFFVALGALATGLGVPRQVVSFSAGYLFGIFQGTVFALLSTVFGCIAIFSYARFMGRSLVQKYFKKRIDPIDAFISNAPFTMTFIIRIMPFGHNALTCVAAGVSKISAFPFFAGSALGYLPQTIIFAVLGSGINLNPLWTTIISAVLFVISSGVGFGLYKKYKNKAPMLLAEESE